VRRPIVGLRALVLVVSAVIAGSLVLVLAGRPELEDAKRRVESAWAPLRSSLDDRHQALGALEEAARSRLGTDRALFADVRAAMSDWRETRAQQVAVRLANRLEGLGARMAVLVEATPRMASSSSVQQAVGRWRRAAAAGDTYNAAVAAYEAVRGGFPRRLVAGVLGYESRRTLERPA
jgi:hypothetical protein